MPVVILVRHAQASFGGVDYDVLSALGHEQVQAVVGTLRERGLRIDSVVSGDLRRQRDTAAPIATLAGVEARVDERWNEYDLDDVLSTHSDSDAREARPPGEERPVISSREFQRVLDSALSAWIAAGVDSAAGETFPDFTVRVQGALADAANACSSGGVAVAVTSGGALGAACAALMGTGPSSMIDFNRVTLNAGISKVVVGSGGMTLVSFNEHGHLERGVDGFLTYR